MQCTAGIYGHPVAIFFGLRSIAGIVGKENPTMEKLEVKVQESE